MLFGWDLARHVFKRNRRKRPKRAKQNETNEISETIIIFWGLTNYDKSFGFFRCFRFVSAVFVSVISVVSLVSAVSFCYARGSYICLYGLPTLPDYLGASLIQNLPISRAGHRIFRMRLRRMVFKVHFGKFCGTYDVFSWLNRPQLIVYYIFRVEKRQNRQPPRFLFF